MERSQFCWLLLALLVATHVPSTTGNKRGVNRSIKIINDTGGKMQIFWVHPETRAPSLMSDPYVSTGAEFPLESYVGHEFEARERGDASGSCNKSKDKVCRHVYFKVSDNDDQTARVTAAFEVEFIDNKIKAGMEASELIHLCQESAQEKIADAEADAEKVAKVMDELLTCVEGGVASALERVNEEIAFQASVRKDIAATLENYTCVDDSLNSTADISSSTWYSPTEHNQAYEVHVKHERVASKIHLIQNFITLEECQAMETEAATTLHRATVADGKGGSQLSENRKAMQAGITVPWDKPDHPISRLSRRVYDYTNHVLDLDIQEHGQEDLMSIQYFGRGRNDTEPDRYTPHCDGDCTGAQHKTGTRVATMVMYCDTADSGGHTNFRNSGVHVKPVPADAIFFSYIDPQTLTMDTGFTEHSGCPVFDGEKKIVTQWIRYGVSVDDPWNSFNTLGIKISDAEED